MAERKFTFNADCTVVEGDLKEATIEKDGTSFIVANADAYPKELNQRPKYALVRNINPGQIAGTFHMGSKQGDVILSLIATINEGCVGLTELEREEDGKKVKIKGVGLVSKTLGIRRGEVYNLEIIKPTIPPCLRLTEG